MQPNRGPAAAARSERSRTRRVAASTVASQPASRRRLRQVCQKCFSPGGGKRYWIREMEGALAGLLKFLVRSRLAWPSCTNCSHTDLRCSSRSAPSSLCANMVLNRNQRMTDKAFVDAAKPATLNNGVGKLTDYPTSQEAVMAWHRLPPEQSRRATIEIVGGPGLYCD